MVYTLRTRDGAFHILAERVGWALRAVNGGSAAA